MKYLTRLFICLFAFSCITISSVYADNHSLTTSKLPQASCPAGVPTTDPTFCSNFKTVTACTCTTVFGQSPAFCNNMSAVYNTMLEDYGSLQNACNAEKNYADPKICFTDWTYYNSNCH